MPETETSKSSTGLSGRGTWLMSQLAPGSTASLIGPLGNGFELPIDRTVPLAFIAGGIGIAPLLELIAQVVSERGAKGTRRPAPFLRRPHGIRAFARRVSSMTRACRSTLQPMTAASATMGALPKCLKNLCAAGDFRPFEIYSCGPLAMQYHVARWALSNDTLAQLSMESLMACGIGACLGCALPGFNARRPGIRTFRPRVRRRPNLFGRIYQMEQNLSPADASPDLAVQLGPLRLKNPVMSASGHFRLR